MVAVTNRTEALLDQINLVNIDPLVSEIRSDCGPCVDKLQPHCVG